MVWLSSVVGVYWQKLITYATHVGEFYICYFGIDMLNLKHSDGSANLFACIKSPFLSPS